MLTFERLCQLRVAPGSGVSVLTNRQGRPARSSAAAIFPRPAIILTRAVFGRRPDATVRTAMPPETSENVSRAAISREKSAVSAHEEAPEARLALLQRHQNR
jgi:hypothetical protein